MGVQTIVHGRISLKGDFEKSRQFIKSLSNDDKYPWIRTEMFSIGASERPYFYDEPIIGFASSYKGLENDWTSFILKFENVLRNVEFDTAKIQMETEFYGTYNFFWKSKTSNDKFEEKEKLIETNEWYFGFGYRCRWGLLDEDLKDEHIFSMDFDYPIKFDTETLNEFNEATKEMEINQTIELGNKVKNYDKLYSILTFGYINKMFDYGLESGKGYWIKKLRQIEIK
ncbi:hypothetical protein OMO38_15950 [Chryseobacterium sp. 09-1422]|uniref:YubB ferredoxin-like domain-containing protein n=1 Tax=Chryseobacterium kimseyorum TaxID=2984028 RepID=A0ABT3I2D1_9FLAO|nr:hypothetical protein [Chryseobacterium kimseyorum]MCW3170018.1 hypothetical protein [Chryseobacterium kimseyorum]